MKGGRLGWLVAMVIGLSATWGGDAAASVEGTGRRAVRHRHRTRLGAGHVVAHRRAPKRSHPEASAAPDVAFVTITTAAKGTSFYVDSRRVGTGSTVRQPVVPGYHQFQAVHPSGARWQKYLSFDAGDDRELIIHW